MFCFKCTKCDYGMAVSSGVPSCEICGGLEHLIRIIPDEYHKCGTTDGKLMEEV